MKKTRLIYALMSMMIMGIVMMGCSTDEGGEPEAEDPIASFQAEVDEDDFFKVSFTNFSQNATIYTWDFGDETGTSTEESPVYTYTAGGEYTVTLTAANDAGVEADFEVVVKITDPNSAATLLLREWYLIADNSTGAYPLQVGPSTRSEIWWAQGLNEELCVRECIYDDSWTFKADGTFDYENNGDFFAEGGVWADPLAASCFDTSNPDNWIGADGQDLSAWDAGNHPFTYDPGAATLTINGGFIGSAKVGTTAEYTEPQESVTYKVIKLV
ncbi:PKD domain-containing protein, partial [Gilvimarinus agarilyticus]|nr:PKD domain-containing protein [Gilvimarinus agarilyticus]